MAVEIYIKTDNLDATKKAIAQTIERSLEEIGLIAERYAAERCHVDTGRLRASISHATEKTQGRRYQYQDDSGKKFDYEIGTGAKENEVYIGTNVEYAPFVEKRFPFLKPAASEHTDEYKKRLADNLSQLQVF